MTFCKCRLILKFHSNLSQFFLAALSKNFLCSPFNNFTLILNQNYLLTEGARFELARELVAPQRFSKPPH